MKKVLSRIFRVRYLLTALLLGTILILILNPNYLYEKGEYFKTEYTEISHAFSYHFLPENPYWDIVLLRESLGKIEFEYMDLSTNKMKHIEWLNYSTNSEINIGVFLYYDKEDEIVYTVLTTDGNNYELFELNQPDKQTFRTKSYHIYKYNTYDSLKTLDNITINSIEFYPYKVLNEPETDFEVEPFKDGVRLLFPVDILTSLDDYKYCDEIETDDDFIKFAGLLSEKSGKEFKAADIYKIITYFRRNNYYNKKLFSKPDYKKRGFLHAKILGKIDVNNDKKKDFLILIHGHRFLNDILLCIDAENKEIIYEKEFAPSLHDHQIVDINGDNVEEILLSFYSPCYEFPFDWHENKTPSTNYKARFYILDNKFNIREINNNIAIESEPGFYQYRFLYLKESNKILLGLRSFYDNSDKKLLLYDIKSDKVDTLDITYQNLCEIKKEKNDIIFWNIVKNKIAKITLDKNFQIRDSIGILVEKQYVYIKRKSIRINKHDYTVINPLTIIDDKLNIIYKPKQVILTGSTIWKGNDCYFIEIKNGQRFLSKLHFERNKTINPYVIIIFLVEILLIITYLFIFQRVKIPLNTGTSSYFVLYTIFGKLYYWQLYGRLTTIYKLPKNVALSKDIPAKIFRDVSEEIKMIFERSFVLFKYKVYEILSYDEFQII
ncbi:MAG: hypothetical protein K8R68_06700 [Bacteroidales bacterium]|nr:hypothetical protein [Bacteroidales bacterium]